MIDVSGSMQDDGKISALRPAAKTFLAALLQDREDRTFVSLVPYAQVVNLGPAVGPRFPLTTEHTRSCCVTFSDIEYRRVDLAAGALIQRLSHFGRDGTWGRGNERSMSLGPIKVPNCPANADHAVTPWSNDLAELQSRIDAHRADGTSTAIGLGAKVGALLLDPSTRPQLSGMIDDASLPPAQRVDPIFAGRPAEYGTPALLKVMVVMSDGKNESQYDIKPAYRTGPSSVWVFQDRRGVSCDDQGDPTGCSDYDPSGPFSAGHAFGTELNPNTSNGRPNGTYRPRYSFYSPVNGRYYIHHRSTWQDTPWGGTEAQQLTWPDVWAHVPHGADRPLPRRRRRSHPRPLPPDARAERITATSRARDDNLSDVCAAARARGVLVYTIAFRAESSARRAMMDCAGPDTPERYFDIQGLDIETAFEGILASIQRVRLTR